MVTRFGVDVGGTFSDLIAYDDTTGRVYVGKGPSTPLSPERGVAELVAHGNPEKLTQSASMFLHGSTTALNALLERKGARVGLLATQGHRDVLELARGSRSQMNALVWRRPNPLVERHLRQPVRERVRADGSVETTLDRDDVVTALKLFESEGVECIAIAFLHAYANPEHELAARGILRDSGFTGAISLSHEVSGEYREYERTSTTVIDAYIKPIMSQYLSRLDGVIVEQGFQGASFITGASGDATTFQRAAERPFISISSGPVAGVVGAADLCRKLDIGEAITFDVGGTSVDCAVISDFMPEITYEPTVIDLPIQTPAIDVRSFGAGGGSIAWNDAGLLRVGPQSAGAEPGPACYGRGGSVPTVTDAAAYLGMMGPGMLASGLTLDIASAETALADLAPELHLSVEELAQGIIRIATANMANAVRELTIQRGRDPRDSALVAFGGAGPLFGVLLAAELEVPKAVVPRHAGNFSAWGLLRQNVARNAARTVVLPLDSHGLSMAGKLIRNLLDELAEAETSETSVSNLEREAVASLDVRFAGQDYSESLQFELNTEWELECSAEDIRKSFNRVYQRGESAPSSDPIEIVAVRTTLRHVLPTWSEQTDPNQDQPKIVAINAYSFTLACRTDFHVYSRSHLNSLKVIQGPAILTEDTTTTYLDHGYRAELGGEGSIIISKDGNR